MKKPLPFCLIAAIGAQRAIGIDNRMPWHLPGDFKFFKAKTIGKPIIMGRKTWDSLGRPLPGRLNIVVSRQAGLELTGATVCPSLEAAIAVAEQWASENGADELMLIGGAQLYSQALEKGLVDRMYLTQVDFAPPRADAWFPPFEESKWTVQAEPPQRDCEDGPEYCFQTWDKA
ncbi:dihydrofolate reductase [Pseudomonas mosselii]|uniref:Dihydrofolate reductase n=1 Tax=Pseudomonas mosselii TaxID=78327 RepID=A0AA42RSV5_9PSED|nr:dihydrofolate reductase [Pseudomonas mosselii]MDH1629484.1 dihydrofolate reductase [Pseudomonas mosselii]